MKKFRWLVFSILFFLFGCQPAASDIVIVDGSQMYRVQSKDGNLLSLLAQNGISLGPNDRILLNGFSAPLDQPLPQSGFTQLQVRRAVALTLNSPLGRQVIQTSALTVGDALNEAGFVLTPNDLIDPPAEMPITQPLSITYIPAQDLTIYIDDTTMKTRSAAGTVGEALAEAGIPLIGLDTSLPLENEPLPVDGQIRVTRVYESINVALRSIPFETERIESADVPLGQEETIQPGVNGIAATRTRTRYENGNEIGRESEDEVIVREAQARIIAGGSQVVLSPLPVTGAPTDYWLATQMYATVYSPCESGTGGCSYATASGARAGYGIVAVDYSIYSYLAGMRVYVPGYGYATIGDTGGGPIIETAFGVPRTKWIDLGFNDGEMIDMTGWVTVYFLAPVPAEIPYFLK